MEKNRFSGKTYEEALEKAKISLQELEENLIIKEISKKSGMFKKVEIEVIEKREVIKFIKNYIHSFLSDMGYRINMEQKVVDNIPTYTIFSDNDSLIIGKNGKNLQALSHYIQQVVIKEIGKPYKFIIDVSEYRKNKDRNLERLAKNIAKEVSNTKVEATLDSMNSYERRIIHNALKDHKYVYTESIGEEPNRKVVIKPKGE